MNMIEIYSKDGSVSELVNMDFVRNVAQSSDGRVIIVTKDCNFESYETLENFQKRTGEWWVDLERWGDKIKVKKSEIVAYSQGKSEGEECVVFKTKGSESSIICDESIESFERKIGIKKEKTE